MLLRGRLHHGIAPGLPGRGDGLRPRIRTDPFRPVEPSRSRPGGSFLFRFHAHRGVRPARRIRRAHRAGDRRSGVSRERRGSSTGRCSILGATRTSRRNLPLRGIAGRRAGPATSARPAFRGEAVPPPGGGCGGMVRLPPGVAGREAPPAGDEHADDRRRGRRPPDRGVGGGGIDDVPLLVGPTAGGQEHGPRPQRDPTPPRPFPQGGHCHQAGRRGPAARRTDRGGRPRPSPAGRTDSGGRSRYGRDFLRQPGPDHGGVGPGLKDPRLSRPGGEPERAGNARNPGHQARLRQFAGEDHSPRGERPGPACPQPGVHRPVRAILHPRDDCVCPRSGRRASGHVRPALFHLVLPGACGPGDRLPLRSCDLDARFHRLRAHAGGPGGDPLQRRGIP